MLLIGDIHITSKHKDNIIESIRSFVSKYDDNQIVFLGDFVYHFSYDRTALIKLFDLFMEFYQQGKNVYILAGNHDWIKQKFVFDQAKKSFDFFQNQIDSQNGKIQFITDFESLNINNTEFLFVPYNIIEDLETDIQLDRDNIQTPLLTKIYDESISLFDSKNKKENLSAKLNLNLLNKINSFYKNSNSSNSKLYIIHHYYIQGKDFPGQYGQFSYKDVAISKLFLELDDVYMISGHLHKSFSFANYFCTGSAWASSPLEKNDFKHFFKLDLNADKPKFQAYLTDINYYLFLDTDSYDIDIQNQKLTKSVFIDIFEKVYNQYQSFFHSDKFDIDFDSIDFGDLDLHKINLILKLEDVDYSQINKYISKDLIDSLGDIQIQKQTMQINEITDLLQKSNKDLQNSIGDWKSLLKDYIQEKYENKDKYLDQLDSLDIL